MFDYSASAATALSLLQNFGKALPIKRVTNTANGVTGETRQTVATGDITTVILPARASALNLVGGQGDDAIVEALVKGKLRFALVAALGATFVPEANDLVTLDGKDWTVLGNTPLSPAGVPILYKLGLQLK